MKRAAGLLLVLLAALPARAQTFDDVFTKIEARFEPVTARPGDTVKWIFTVELIPGWHTYPTKQTDPSPNAESQVTKFKFPKPGQSEVTVVDKLKEPANSKKKAEPSLGIKELLYYEGTVVWEQPMV